MHRPRRDAAASSDAASPSHSVCTTPSRSRRRLWWLSDSTLIPLVALTEQTAFWCPSAKTFATSSVVWGLIGPARQFNQGKIYSATLFGFLVGARPSPASSRSLLALMQAQNFAGGLAPIPFYFLAKRYPSKWYKVHRCFIIVGRSVRSPRC